MKITIYEGATLNEATDNLVKSIDNSVGEHIVVVPDRFSLLMEKQLLSSMKNKAMFNVSVVGLSSLVLTLLKEIGINNINMVGMADSLLLTAKAIKNVNSQLEVFKKNNINFCHMVQNAISQFKSSGVTPDDLLNIKQSLISQKKYKDLGLIYQEYEKLLNGKLDANGLLEYFNFVMRKTHILTDKTFYFAGFDAFTHQSFELVKTLSYFAKELVFALPKSISQGNDYIYEYDIINKLKEISIERSINIEVISPKFNLNDAQNKIAQNLFSFDLKAGESDNFLTLMTATGAKEEAFMIAKILKYRIFKGDRYKNFAIACSDLEKYAPHFEQAFTALDIPYYLDVSVTADKSILANFVFNVLDVFVKDFSKESLQALASNVILNLQTREEVCKKIESINYLNRPRYKKYIASFEPKINSLLNVFESELSYRQMGECFKQVILELAENYNNILSTLKDSDRVKEYNINSQIQTLLFEAFDKITEYYGDEKCNKSEYLKQIKLLLMFQEVTSVPTYVDAVIVGDATTSFYGDVENLIIVGGELLPHINGDNALISDDDINQLKFMKKIEPSVRMINRRNRFKLFNLLCSARKSLFISCLSFNDEGKKVETPTYVENLKKCFGQKVVNSASFSRFSGADYDLDIEKLLLISGGRNIAIEQIFDIYNKFNTTLNSVLKVDLNTFELNKTYIKHAPHNLFFPKDYTKVTQLETYFSCPFKHFVRYGLRANELERYEFDERDIGNICHRFADMFLKKYKSKLADLSYQIIENFINENIFNVLKQEMLDDKLDASIDKDSLIKYIKRITLLMFERIVQEQKVSSFNPLYTEKNLENLTLKYGNNSIKLIGKVDRIDVSGDYFRILDYKTGKVNPILKDLYYGDKLQLFLYESGVKQTLAKLPAGSFYFDCRWDYDSLDNQDVIMKGIVLNDENVLKMFDRELSCGNNKIIAVSPKSTGGFKGQALSKYSLNTFEEYAKRVSAIALKEIEEGYIEPKPDASACERCAFKSICLFDSKKGYRKKDRINQEDIMEALKNES